MNKSAQFTPGPWHVEKCSAPVYGSDGTLMVNGVGIGAGSRHIGTISSKNAHNDANLIAAAPAMYEALQIMVRATNVDEIDPLVMFASIERARAVLELAEGKVK